jgi:hypothetical protein
VIEARGNGISTLAMRFPSFSRGRLHHAETCAGDPGGCPQTLRRYSAGDLSVARSPSLYLTGFAQDGADAYFVRTPGRGPPQGLPVHARRHPPGLPGGSEVIGGA